MRTAIYARYSSDQQNERSIDDQVRLCCEHAQRLGAEIVAVYADYAISGSSLRNRPEANRLLDDARAQRFELVIAEALDRLSRDQEDVAGIFKRFGFAGVRLVTVSEGEISELHVGLKGTMNALFLKDLAAKVRRGAAGRIAAGFSAGGLSYGYKVVREIDAAGNITAGRRAIDEDQANVVRRIFGAYAAGDSARRIAAALNAEGVPAPRGARWNASTINGHPGRGNGILFNELYIGRLLWNRVAMVKDPDTGRRLSRLNPTAARQAVDVPELRIVPDELWQAAQARKRSSRGIRPERQQRPRHLLSGLLRCGCCGGAYISKGADLLGCARYAESGDCSNGGSTKRSQVEARVLTGLRAHLLNPEAVRPALAAFRLELERLAGDRHRRRRDLGRRLAQVKAEIERYVDWIGSGKNTPASEARLIALDAKGGERERLEAELAGLEQQAGPLELHPAALELYASAVDDLRLALAGDGAAPEAIALMRQLVDRIVIQPAGAGRPPGITLYGRLAELLAKPVRVLGPFRSGGMMVAGEGLEPPTLGL